MAQSQDNDKSVLFYVHTPIHRLEITPERYDAGRTAEKVDL
jgi:hypothetical protein